MPPALHNTGPPEWRSDIQPQQVLSGIVSLYNWIKPGILDAHPGLPAGCAARRPVASHFDEQAPPRHCLSVACNTPPTGAPLGIACECSIDLSGLPVVIPHQLTPRAQVAGCGAGVHAVSAPAADRGQIIRVMGIPGPHPAAKIGLAMPVRQFVQGLTGVEGAHIS